MVRMRDVAPSPQATNIALRSTGMAATF